MPSQRQDPLFIELLLLFAFFNTRPHHFIHLLCPVMIWQSVWWHYLWHIHVWSFIRVGNISTQAIISLNASLAISTKNPLPRTRREQKQVKMAKRQTTSAAGMTGLNFSQAESLSVVMVMEHGQTNKRKPNLPVADWCLYLSLFIHWHYDECWDWTLWGLATQVTQRERSGNVVRIFPQAWQHRRHMLTRLSLSTKQSLLSTENKLSSVWHPEWVSCPFFMTTFGSQCLIKVISW